MPELVPFSPKKKEKKEKRSIRILNLLHEGIWNLVNVVLTCITSLLQTFDLFLYCFSGTDLNPSMEINQWKSSFGDNDVNKFVLIAFDGTWKHAKEMVSASFPFVSKFATQVCLTYDIDVDGGTIFSSDLTLRKEPFGGCMSTMEAVARCLRILEPNGIEIESRLVEVLKKMVKFQASFMKPINRRPKLLKKGKEDDKKSNSGN